VLFDRINTTNDTMYKYTTLFMAHMVAIACYSVLTIQFQIGPTICLHLFLLKMFF